MNKFGLEKYISNLSTDIVIFGCGEQELKVLITRQNQLAKLLMSSSSNIRNILRGFFSINLAFRLTKIRD